MENSFKNFSQSLAYGLDQVEVGKQFARSELTRSLAEDPDFLGIIRRGEHVTVLFPATQHQERRRMAWQTGPWL